MADVAGMEGRAGGQKGKGKGNGNGSGGKGKGSKGSKGSLVEMASSITALATGKLDPAPDTKRLLPAK